MYIFCAVFYTLVFGFPQFRFAFLSRATLEWAKKVGEKSENLSDRIMCYKMKLLCKQMGWETIDLN